MHRLRMFPAVFVLVATITGCSTSQNPDTMEAEIRFIRSLMERYDSAVYGPRLDYLMTFYADNAVLMPPNQPVVIGKEAIRSRFEGRDFTGELSSKEEDLQVSSDWAFMRLSYTESMTPQAGGETSTVTGKWVVILQRELQGWTISTEIWNTDSPNN